MAQARSRMLPFEEMTPLQQRLRLLGEHVGLENSQLGIAAGLSTDTVNKWVRRSHVKDEIPGAADEWRKLAARHGASIDWLWSSDPLPPGSKVPTKPGEWGPIVVNVGASPSWSDDLQVERYRKQLREVSSRLGLHDDIVVVLEGKRDVPEAMAAELPNQVKTAIVAAAQVTGHPIDRVAEIATILSRDASLLSHRDTHTVGLWFDELRRELQKLPDPGSGTRARIATVSSKPPPGKKR